MRDAFGGIVNISMIVVFLVVVSGYLAFNVTYTKAFRMKNEIIKRLEQYEGSCEENSKCMEDITNYANSIGYNLELDSDEDANPRTIFDETAYRPTCSDRGYCWCRYDVKEGERTKSYFKVTTKIVIQIPIINNVMENMDAFTLSGNTKLVTIQE